MVIDDPNISIEAEKRNLKINLEALCRELKENGEEMQVFFCHRRQGPTEITDGRSARELNAIQQVLYFEDIKFFSSTHKDKDIDMLLNDSLLIPFIKELVEEKRDLGEEIRHLNHKIDQLKDKIKHLKLEDYKIATSDIENIGELLNSNSFTRRIRRKVSKLFLVTGDGDFVAPLKILKECIKKPGHIVLVSWEKSCFEDLKGVANEFLSLDDLIRNHPAIVEKIEKK